MSFKKRTAVVVAVIAVVLLLALLLPTYHGRNPTISVTMTSANLRFVYRGSSVGYLWLMSNVLSNNTIRARSNDTIQFTDTIAFRNNGSAPHEITSVFVLTKHFNIVSNGSLPSLPFDLTPGAALDFTLVIRYEGQFDYTGPLDIQVSTE